MSELALFGGPKTITKGFPPYNPIGKEEVEAAKAVVKTGVLSPFLGSWSPNFYGGKKIQEFERAWEKYFDVKHAVSVNSNTSGLIAAIGAVGIEPGDEVIVSPWTMCATATSILFWNAIPVFADIEEDTFNLDPVSVEKNITPYTKAILVTDIFGHAADLDAIIAIGKKHNLKIIEDAAQSPGAMYKGRYVGTIADIGVFSLNYHKHIHTGEGGVCVTNNAELAERMQLIRNHAEAVVGDKGVTNLSNMIGFNFRLTEVQAAIGIEQLKKLKTFFGEKNAAAARLSKGLAGLKGLRTPVVKSGCTHSYYIYPLVYDEDKTGVPRDLMVKAIRAEGVAVSGAYVNLHLLPVYQKKTAYGTKGFPWNSEFYKGDVSYQKGICPVAEKLQDSRYVGIGMCLHKYTDKETDLIIQAFHKVWSNLQEFEQK
ncbi:MAG: DegT/DnrJ/EryC1/StrS family aminotransferase [Sedimentisphaerales bacterium]|nr:DegT/DnrJ/EryC1/StrS family aminotransferase [Sedimentisphaerales bacterium]